MEYPGHPLRRGSRGPAVRFLQEQVGAKQIDGVFGRQTQKAVRAVQSRRRLKVDGVVGRNTWLAITN